MTVRSGRGERAHLRIAALALIAPLFAAGCATPRTHFVWFTNTAPARPKPVAERHVAEEQQPRCICNPVPVPTPRPMQQAPKPIRNGVEQASVSGHALFSWPVRGRILEDFGAGSGGTRNDGINIAVSEGEPIRAAGDGLVTYSGDGLKNYGNLVLIKHDNGYATVYAHAQSLIVSKGDRVARGQVIGYGGQTGEVTSPQLHFEIRRDARTPIDPRSVLGPLQVASR